MQVLICMCKSGEQVEILLSSILKLTASQCMSDELLVAAVTRQLRTNCQNH